MATAATTIATSTTAATATTCCAYRLGRKATRFGKTLRSRFHQNRCQLDELLQFYLSISNNVIKIDFQCISHTLLYIIRTV